MDANLYLQKWYANAFGEPESTLNFTPDKPYQEQPSLTSTTPDWREQAQSWLSKKTGMSPRAAGNITGGPQGDLAGAGLADVPTLTGAATAYKDWEQDPSLANSFNLTTSMLPGKAIFLGLGAKLSKETMDWFKKATQLEQAGIKNEEIRQITGWFRGADNDWRREISDRDATLNKTGLSDIGLGGRRTLPSIMEHPELYEAYPHLNDMSVGTKTEAQGAFTGNSIEISPFHVNKVMSDNENFAKEASNTVLSTILHEVQHAIQTHENFAKGANPKFMETLARDFNKQKEAVDTLDILYDAKNKFMAKYSVNGDKIPSYIKTKINTIILNDKNLPELSYDTWNDLDRNLFVSQLPKSNTLNQKIRTELSNKIPEVDTYFKLQLAINYMHGELYKDVKVGENLYYKTAGEVEARNVERRRNMTLEERRQFPPSSTEDVTLKDQIVFRNKNEAETLKPNLLDYAKSLTKED